MADDQRRKHIRLDDDHRQKDLELARKLIFERGLGIKSKGVEGLLESKSYTPTRVCIFVRIHTLHPLTNVLLERVFPSALPIQLQFFRYVRPRSPA